MRINLMKQFNLFPTLILATVMILAMACSSTPKCTIHGCVFAAKKGPVFQ